MCRATLLPDPESPLTRMSRIADVLLLPNRLARLGGVFVGLLFLVLQHAAVELVGQQIDGGVHVLFRGVGMNRIAAHMQGGFGLLSELLNREDAMHVDYVVEMAGNAFELLLDVGAHRRGDFDMMTGKRQLHDPSPFLAYLPVSLSICLIAQLLPCVRLKGRAPEPRDISRPYGARPRCPRRREVRRCGCRTAGC